MGRTDAIQQLRSHLDAATTMRAAARSDAASGAQREAIRAWQAARLTRTYADLLADSRYRPAAEFFLNELYSAADHSARDAEMLRALPKLARLLPAAALDALGLALELDALSERLDAAVARALFGERTVDPLPAFGQEDYAAAYRRADQRADRLRQIELVDGVGHTLDKIAHSALLTGSVQMMRGPARAARLGELQGFLERGLAAFQGMRGAADFLAIIRRRETSILERLFAGSPQPFEVA